MFDDVCSTFLLKECFAFDQTFRPKMLKRLAGFSTLLNLQMLYNNVRSFSPGLFKTDTAMNTTPYSFRSCIRGVHAYEHFWNAVVGKVLDCGVRPISPANVKCGVGNSAFDRKIPLVFKDVISYERADSHLYFSAARWSTVS